MKKGLAILAMVLMFCGSALAMDVTLQWDANSESNLAGYKIYYDSDSNGPPYNGTGATEGNSPINVGNVTTFTIHGFPNDASVRFAATAYNTENLESGYSNEVIASLAPANPTGLIADQIAAIISALQNIRNVLTAQVSK